MRASDNPDKLTPVEIDPAIEELIMNDLGKFMRGEISIVGGVIGPLEDLGDIYWQAHDGSDEPSQAWVHCDICGGDFELPGEVCRHIRDLLAAVPR